MEKSHYICPERLDWTAQFEQKMEEVNQSPHTILGPVSSRIVGFVDNIDLKALGEENLRIADQLKNLPSVNNTDLLNRIVESEKRLRESKEMEDLSKSQYESLKNSRVAFDNSKIDDSLTLGDSQTEKQKVNNIFNLALEPAPDGAMKIGTRPAPNLALMKQKQEELKQKKELENSQKLQAQTKNNESQKKKIIQLPNSGTVSIDMLQNVKLRSTTNLTKSQQPLLNSLQSVGLNSSINNFSSFQSNSTTSLFLCGFENRDQFNDLSNSWQNQVLKNFKKSCKDIYHEIKGLEKGQFLAEHQDYLEKMSKSISINQTILIDENIDKINRWIDALENKNILPEKQIDFSSSMISFGFSNDANNLKSDELDEMTNYFKVYKTALQYCR